MTKAILRAAALLAIAAAGGANAEDYPDKLLWGDTHLHTNLSVDAYFLGNRSIDADTAYRFARGEPVIHPYHRARMQLETPLDFLAVSDHAELLGAAYGMIDLKDKRLTNTRLGKRITKLYDAGDWESAFGLFILAITTAETPPAERPKKIGPITALFWRLQSLIRPIDARALATRWLLSDPTLLEEIDNRELAHSFWSRNMDAAEHNYRPGSFTTLVGWEYTPTPNGANLHRIVISDAAPSVAKSFYPFSANDSGDPEDLWRWLAAQKAATGAEFVSIPHNSNISKGRMFATVDHDGRPMTADYARLRAAWEPVAEITQIKGASETHPAISPNDEFAAFEFFGRLIEARPGADHRPTTSPADYIRSALKTGLELEAKLGVNPYKLGVIGSTDSHSGLSTAEENNFGGKFAYDSIPERKLPGKVISEISGWDMSASGLAAVWARANTRKEIIAAFKRREVYATTGPRMAVRFYGGFGFTPEDASSPDIAAIGYAKGVPMGGDIASNGADGGLSFLIEAVKDPKGANLDRVQIVKGWLGSDGKAREKVFNVVWSGDRSLDSDGRLPPVGDTVDRARALYSNSIGAPRLAAVWTDPEFNPAQRAFYYVRVLQIPTPRNSLYDSIALGAPHPAGYAPVIQERAYTSPVWYSPAKG